MYSETFIANFLKFALQAQKKLRMLTFKLATWAIISDTVHLESRLLILNTDFLICGFWDDFKTHVFETPNTVTSFSMCLAKRG